MVRFMDKWLLDTHAIVNSSSSAVKVWPWYWVLKTFANNELEIVLVPFVLYACNLILSLRGSVFKCHSFLPNFNSLGIKQLFFFILFKALEMGFRVLSICSTVLFGFIVGILAITTQSIFIFFHNCHQKRPVLDILFKTDASDFLLIPWGSVSQSSFYSLLWCMRGL